MALAMSRPLAVAVPSNQTLGSFSQNLSSSTARDRIPQRRNTNSASTELRRHKARPKLPTLEHDSSTGSLDTMTTAPSHDTYVDTQASDSPSTFQPEINVQITKSWDIPPRPKPGRKPAIEMPPTKRKAQNRDSQRKFRQKKVEEVTELREKLQLKDVETQQREQELVSDRQKIQHDCQQWRDHALYWQQTANANQAAISELEARVLDLQDQLRQATRGSGDSVSTITTDVQGSDHNGSIPTYDTEEAPRDYIERSLDERGPQSQNTIEQEEMEIDLTTYGKRPPTTAAPVQQIKTDDFSMPSLALDTPMEDTCGFCDRGGLCLCNEVAQQINTLPAMSAGVEGEVNNSLRRAQTMEPPTTATGPGTCDACLRDPERRRFCESLASQVQLPPLVERTERSEIEPAKRRAKLNSVVNHDVRDAHPNVRITCADTYERLKHFAHFRANSSRIIQELKPERAHGDEPSGTLDGIGRAPLAVDAASLDAACMLAAMSERARVHSVDSGTMDVKR